MSIEQIDMLTGMTKEETAIKFLQAVEPPAPIQYYGGFSGGKDSVVIKHLASVQAQVRVDWHYCQSPIDPLEIYQFIREFHPDVQRDNHIKPLGISWWQLVAKKGLPIRQKRWCCKYIKEAGGLGRVLILGNRRDEGTIRKGQKCFEQHNKWPKIDKTFVRPILYWSEGEVWEYIEKYNLPYCKLYDDEYGGFKRLGCVLCPFSRNVKKEIYYFPKVAYLWRRACDQIIARRKASGRKVKREFADGQELWDWWISREK